MVHDRNEATSLTVGFFFIFDHRLTHPFILTMIWAIEVGGNLAVWQQEKIPPGAKGNSQQLGEGNGDKKKFHLFLCSCVGKEERKSSKSQTSPAAALDGPNLLAISPFNQSLPFNLPFLFHPPAPLLQPVTLSLLSPRLRAGHALRAVKEQRRN